MSRLNVALIGLLVLIGLILAITQWSNLSGYLPFLFLLACPFLHLFFHGGHGNHTSHTNEKETPKDPSSSSPHHHV